MSNYDIREDGLSGLGLEFARCAPQITDIWLRRCREEIPTARELAHPILIDTYPQFLRNLAEALSPDFPREIATETTTIAQEHGGERARLTNYHPQNLLSEYLLLKEIIFDVLEQRKVGLNTDQRRVINASIDVALRDALTAFVLVQTTIREQFMATLTHDLRNPLSAISMSASLILKKPDGKTTPLLAAKILESARRIDHMIQDLLDATMVRMGGHLKFDVTEFDLLELVRETTTDMATSVGDRFVLKGAPCLGFWGRDALKRALENLLVNAEKYGDPNEKITVEVGSRERRVVLSVHNEGNPIPAEDQEAIFQVFLRAQAARTGKKKGWGLGLALVRAVAESHGGSIVVDSEISRGTTFVLDLPQDCRPYVGHTPTTSGQ
jgi:signal transduction histidine kinase